jgi:hypothetical protein
MTEPFSSPNRPSIPQGPPPSAMHLAADIVHLDTILLTIGAAFLLEPNNAIASTFTVEQSKAVAALETFSVQFLVNLALVVAYERERTLVSGCKVKTDRLYMSVPMALRVLAQYV